jgi:hypothetical protein
MDCRGGLPTQPHLLDSHHRGLSADTLAGWAREPEAGQDLRDTFSRQVDPSRVMSKERLARWSADAPSPAGG